MRMTDENIKEYRKLKEQKKKQLDRQNKYVKANYDRIGFVVPKGEKQKIIEHLEKLGYENITSYIVDLIKKDMEKSP